MPTVSLVIPCYNHRPWLVRAVASGLSQSHLHELIIVDDHSTDGSLEVARELAASDQRILCVQTGHNIGPGGARNAGARLANGDYLSFLDADDELLGDFFKDALALLEAQPETILVKAEMEFFDSVKGYILPSFDPRHQSAILSSSCGLVMPREAFLRMGGFPEDRIFRGPHGGEDVAFMEVIIKHFQPIGRIERACYRVWSQAGSHLDNFLSNTRLKDDSFEFVRVYPDRAPGGVLSMAIDSYLSRVAELLDA